MVPSGPAAVGVSEGGLISVIVTVRITETLFEAESRIKSLCETLPEELFEIVVVDYGTAPEFRPILDELAASGIRVAAYPNPSRIFSIGAARNFGAQIARNPVLLFLDIDFHAPTGTFTALHEFVAEKRLEQLTAQFFCVPVLFLTEAGTKLYESDMESGRNFPVEPDTKHIESQKGIIDFPSYGSSAILVNRRHYLAIGGHDQTFFGHGAEDFEMLHRLSSLSPWGDRPTDYYTDTKVKNFEPLSGFRPYFARYALPVLERGLFLVHRYHPKRTEPGYFRHWRNFANARRLMRLFDNRSEMPLPLTDVNSPDSALVVAGVHEPGFAKIRPIIASFKSYRLIDEDSAFEFRNIENLISTTSVNTVLIRSPYGSPRRANLHNGLKNLSLRLIEF